MSKKAALEFIEKSEKDKAFRAQLLKAKNAQEKKNILKKANLLFTKKEFLEAYKEKYHKTLTEADLMKVVAAGGQVPAPAFGAAAPLPALGAAAQVPTALVSVLNGVFTD